MASGPYLVRLFIFDPKPFINTIMIKGLLDRLYLTATFFTIGSNT